MTVIHAGKPPTATRQGRVGVGVAVAALAIMQFVLVLDSAIINVALATIGHDLEAPPDRLTWVVNAYALAFGGLLLIGGRLADLAGARRLFVLGTALFGLASLAGAFASTVAWLVASRAAQGAGAAMAAPAAPPPPPPGAPCAATWASLCASRAAQGAGAAMAAPAALALLVDLFPDSTRRSKA